MESMYTDNPQIKEFKILEQSEDGKSKIMYMRSKAPMMSEREILMQSDVKEVGPGQELYLTHSVNRDDKPIKKGLIRMTLYDASLVEQDGDDLKLIKYSNMDLGGYFPVRLLNMVIAAT